ncbi:TorF family putative porin [Aureibaculum conchae]|uniref:TorF family putative porin n=1 Tax=Aureibaculum sp. 2308TA14-22 TaxID=3108392 RepID=UPI0033972E08
MENYSKLKNITYGKKILFIFLFLSGLILFAQKEASLVKPSKIDIGVGLQSRYIWRGLQLGGNSPSIQPSVEFTAGKFILGAWGAYSTRGFNEFQEADLYVSYTPIEALSLTITDYFFPKEGAYNNYFEHGNNTGHVYEALISFNGTEKIPIGIILATNFAGAIKYDENESEKKAYSTYIEATYSKKVANTAYSIFAGAVFGDYNSYYLTDGSGFINLGLSATKEIKITDNFNLPINAALTFNPEQENIYLTFGCSL